MRTLIFFSLLVVISVTAVADHLPETLMARGKLETTLAKVNLETGSVDEVLKRLGPPTRKITAPNNPYWAGYVWDSPTTRLEVEVTHSKTRQFLGGVTVVRMKPADASSDASESTGRGLKLGDTLDDLKRIYGPKLQLVKQENIPADTAPFLYTPGSELAIVQWKSLDFTLTAGLDDQGRILALSLRPPSCYPGGCK
jgi:hypothetical protein